MKRLITVVTTSGALVLLTLTMYAVPRVAAGPPLHFRYVLNITLPQYRLSALCGFPVFRHIEGFTDATLFLNDDGNPVHEIDTVPSWKNTFFSPVTGKSVSFPGTGTLITDYYPDGSAVARVEGLMTLIRIPGGGPLLLSAGRIVFTAIVVEIDSNGVPHIGLPIDILFETGVDEGTEKAACDALAPQ